MRILVNVSLACCFVFLAGFNVWNMLAGGSVIARKRNLWTQIHRAAGYAFIALFTILCYLMLIRVKGRVDELSPKVVLHMGMALLLAPLLLIKVLSVRYQKAARGLPMALGIGIFAIAFTLVAMNLATHYLERASPEKPAGGISAIVAAVSIALAAIAFARGGKSPGAKATAQVPGSTADRSAVKSDDAVLLTLARIEPQARDAKTLRFLLPRGRSFAARPGQFLTFEWMVGSKCVTRSYSICSSPTQRGFIEITPKRVANGVVSVFLNDQVAPGLAVKARGPYGRFYFDEDKHKRIVLIAGGSGITPLISMLRYIDDLCVPVACTLIYCIRRQEDIFFRDELKALGKRLSRFRAVIVLSQPDANWTGWVGRLRTEILACEITNPKESTFFLCGPPPFMELGRTLLSKMSVEPERILQESFGGAVGKEKQPAGTDGIFRVEFARSGLAHHISPDETLLDSAEKNSVLIPSGCRQGNCGTCATRLLAGDVTMGDAPALNEELKSKGYILPCVSRALSDLTLDA